MIEVILSDKLSVYDDKRYIVVDKETGEVLDDAQGYGYKSQQNAYRAYAYKTRDKSKDAEKEQTKKAVKEWCRKNKIDNE